MTPIEIPSLRGAIERALLAAQAADGRNNAVIHASDLAVHLPDDPTGAKCPRQLWLRLNGAEKREPHYGILLMWEAGHRLEKWIATEILPEWLDRGWKVRDWKRTVSDALPGDAEGELDILLDGPNGERVVADVKTVRGNAFRYLDRPKASHELQVRTYCKAEDADYGLLLYVDREGQNGARQYYVERDDEQVEEAYLAATEIAAREEPPPMLELVPKGRKRSPYKEIDGEKMVLPWNCQWCHYAGISCPTVAPELLEKQ